MKQTDGKFAPNFVVEDPEKVFEERTFSLKLGTVPASVALKYSLDGVRATARYDEHAIVIKPLGGRKGGAPKDDGLLDKPAPKKSVDPFAR